MLFDNASLVYGLVSSKVLFVDDVEYPGQMYSNDPFAYVLDEDVSPPVFVSGQTYLIELRGYS
jgi:hypothetical protein